MMIYGWDNPYNMVRDELDQLRFEGRIIPEDIREAFERLDPRKDRYNEDELEILFGKLEKSDSFPRRKDWKYIQPDDLETIKAQRPEYRPLQGGFEGADLLDKLHGAWTGRACGCALGKPVELMGMYDGGRARIKENLRNAGRWPLNEFFSARMYHKENFPMICEDSWLENITCMEPDDDIHYTLIGLKVLETYGRDFTWRQVADTWNNSLPFGAICTAETQAILNYNMRTHWLERDKCPLSPDFTSRWNNPYREWIGAQIRADGWAYCCAGDPEGAAEMAWRDARWTHRANGIYGEMFAAAMIACAFAENDPLEIIRVGLSQIPEKSILAEAVREALEWFPLCGDWETFMDRVDEKYAGMSGVHTVNNALICVMAIYYGRMDPDRSISIAVMAGLDTDCNGATVGSITGASGGIKAFGRAYAPKLNDRIRPLVFGFQEVSIRELAERSLALWKSFYT